MKTSEQANVARSSCAVLFACCFFFFSIRFELRTYRVFVFVSSQILKSCIRYVSTLIRCLFISSFLPQLFFVQCQLKWNQCFMKPRSEEHGANISLPDVSQHFHVSFSAAVSCYILVTVQKFNWQMFPNLHVSFSVAVSWYTFVTVQTFNWQMFPNTYMFHSLLQCHVLPWWSFVFRRFSCFFFVNWN